MTSEICGKALGKGSRLLALHLQERRERSVHAAKVKTDWRGGDRRMLSDWWSIPVGLGEGGKGGPLVACEGEGLSEARHRLFILPTQRCSAKRVPPGTGCPD